MGKRRARCRSRRRPGRHVPPHFGRHAGGVAAAPTWVVVTDQRIMLFEYVQRGHRLGGMLFEVPRNEVTVTSKPGVFAGVELVDPTSGDPVVRLNFGVFKQNAAAVVTAAA
jgi:hypothetical protein